MALYPLNSANAADDGLDALLEHREVCILRQAIQRGVKVKVGVSVCQLGEDLGHGTPAKYPGIAGQGARLVGVESFHGSKDALEE